MKQRHWAQTLSKLWHWHGKSGNGSRKTIPKFRKWYSNVFKHDFFWKSYKQYAMVSELKITVHVTPVMVTGQTRFLTGQLPRDPTNTRLPATHYSLNVFKSNYQILACGTLNFNCDWQFCWCSIIITQLKF